MPPTAVDVAEAWLARFSKAVADEDAPSLAAAFVEHGWLRDSLVFTWNSRSLCGHEKIIEYLRNSLATARVSEIKRHSVTDLETKFFPVPGGSQGVEFAFAFKTSVGPALGYVRLLGSLDSLDWKALTVFTELQAIAGHPEAPPELDWANGHTKAWKDVFAERKAAIERDPHVVIIGAGQTGLQIAARFKQLGLPTLIIEKNSRVGDNWRQRYPTLALHTPRSHHQLLYQPFPSNWPIFTPRDKLADWFEHYAIAQDLVVWSSSHIMPTPRYDEYTRKWQLTVNRDGREVTLHPSHVVLATGTLGKPALPEIPSLPEFKGIHFHASAYQGGQAFAGKRVVVLGAGNTSADICQDLSVQGAASVTMVQRSSTCVVSQDATVKGLLEYWPFDVSVEISDFKSASMPIGLLKELNKGTWLAQKAHDKAMLDGLTKAGLLLNDGLDNSGQLILVFARAGGYWLDVGVADLIISGKVKVKRGVEIQEFRESSIVFTDGSELDADVVIFATGYQNIRPSMKEVFGAETIDRTSEVYGLDEEGELRGCYKPSGHPGLWYGAGDFVCSRYASRQLGLLIQAIKLGLLENY